MNSSQQAQATTRMFARVIGPFLVIVTATAVARASAMRTLLTEFPENSVWPWVTGAFVLLTGLIVVAFHQHWRGAPAIIVSILGWLTALKGFFLMAFPQTYLSFASRAVDAVTWWQAGFIAMALVGLYLTFIGWIPVPSRPTMQRADRRQKLQTQSSFRDPITGEITRYDVDIARGVPHDDTTA